MSKKNPATIRFSKNGIVSSKNKNNIYVDDKTKMGYMSKTTNTFQLGVKGAN